MRPYSPLPGSLEWRAAHFLRNCTLSTLELSRELAVSPEAVVSSLGTGRRRGFFVVERDWKKQGAPLMWRLGDVQRWRSELERAAA